MLTSITPLGERGRANRWAVTVTAYVLGSAAAGAALGGLLGLLGRFTAPSGTVGTVLLAAAAGAAAALELTGRRPASWHRQVDENWLHAFRGWFYGVGYGLQLGAGVLTIVTSSVVYAAWLAAWLAGGAGAPWGAVLVGTTFGLARSLPLVGTVRVRSWAGLRALHARLDRALPRMRLLTATGSAAVCLAALAVGLGGGR